ncbi:glutamate receptor 3-like [Contarinia nasturtii]|uniref:glutamate receptor 3-like n=1 Tax=Contarinia nasturtii TaxID=265458 RepID=UPI0012D38916|nr:glutamate receptor 3-like [Contarinia nasturtii]
MCWPKMEAFNFIKRVSIQMQIVESKAPIRLPTDEYTNKQWFFIDMNCEHGDNYLSNVENKYFAHPYRWIIADATEKVIKNLSFLPNSNIILANWDNNSERIILKQVYKVAIGMPLIYEDFGLWTKKDGLIDLRTTRILSRRRRNLQGYQLKATTVFMNEGSENHTDLDDTQHKNIDMASKVCLLLAKHWVESVNATMVTDVQRTWGYKDPKTGQFSGMVGRLQMKEADIGDQKYFSHPYRWIMVHAKYEAIQNLPFLPDSNVLIVNQDIDSKDYILKQVYRISMESSLIYEEFGVWNATHGLVDYRKNRILSRRRRNLQNHNLVAATVFMQEGSENYPDLDDYQHNTVDTVSKLSLLITKHWIESVNATMRFDVHRTWGYKDPKSGIFSGMSGQLQKKEADIGGTIIFITKERIGIMEYLSMQIPTYTAFILRPPNLSNVSNIYYLPFSGIVWICSILLVILCTLVIALTMKFQFLPDKTTENMGISDYIMFAIASSCQMGSEYLTKIVSTRISLFFFFVALLFIYNSFTANIVALLQSTTKSFRSISDLNNPAIEIGVHDTVFNRHYFKIETEPTRKQLYESKIAPNAPNVFMNISYGISRLREGMFAFHTETSPAYTAIERTFYENEKCGLIEIKFLKITGTWSAIQKKSPYKEILKVNMMKIREHGIQLRERARVYRNKPKCDSNGKNFGSVRLIDCKAVFLILAYGFLASIVIFCAEKFFQSKLNEIFVQKVKLCETTLVESHDD